MVKAPGAASRPGGIRPLNTPRPLAVRSDGASVLRAVKRGGRWLAVASIEDRWRVEDEWWREGPVQRSYFEVRLEDGRRVTLFLDERERGWYSIRA